MILFLKFHKIFLRYLNPVNIVFLIQKDKFRGDLTCVFVLADVAVRSLRKLFIFSI